MSSKKRKTATKSKSAAQAKPRTRSDGQPAKRKLPIGWILGGVAAVVLVLVVVLTMGSTDDPPDEFGDPTVSGESLPAHDRAAAVDEAVGQTIPEVDGANFEGTPVSITNNGTPKAIAFLAHWCPHCQAEVPEIQEWLDTNEVPGDVEIISVATGIDPNRTNYPSSEWLEGEDWTPPVIVDSQTGRVSRAYGLTGFPMWVFVDGDGNVVARTSGQSPIETWEAMLNQLAQT